MKINKKIKYQKFFLIIITLFFIKFPQKSLCSEEGNIIIRENEETSNIKIYPYGGIGLSGSIQGSNKPSLGYGSKFDMNAKFYLGTKSEFYIGVFSSPIEADISLGMKMANIGTDNDLKPYIKNGFITYQNFKIGYDESLLNSDVSVFLMSYKFDIYSWLENTLAIESTNNGYFIKNNITNSSPTDSFDQIKIKKWSCIAIADRMSFKNEYLKISFGALYKGIAYYANETSKIKYQPCGVLCLEHTFQLKKNWTSLDIDFYGGAGAGRYIDSDIEKIESETPFNLETKNNQNYLSKLNTLFSAKASTSLKQYVIPQRMYVKLYYSYTTCGREISKIFEKHNRKEDFTSNKSNGWKKINNLGLNCAIDLSKIEKRLRLGFDLSTGFSEEDIIKGELSLGMSLI